MEPLSISSSGAGLISLSLTTCNAIIEYCSSAKDANKDVSTLNENAKDFKCTVEVLQDFLQTSDGQDLRCTKLVQDLIARCISHNEKLCKKLHKIKGCSSQDKHLGFGRRALYPFQHKTVQKLASTVQYAKQDLAVALTLFQSMNQGKGISNMQSSLGNMSSAIQNLDVTVRSAEGNSNRTLQTSLSEIRRLSSRADEMVNLQYEVLENRNEDRAKHCDVMKVLESIQDNLLASKETGAAQGSALALIETLLRENHKTLIPVPSRGVDGSSTKICTPRNKKSRYASWIWTSRFASIRTYKVASQKLVKDGDAEKARCQYEETGWGFVIDLDLWWLRKNLAMESLGKSNHGKIWVRSTNRRNSNCPVFDFAQNGNIEAVRAAFSLNQASVDDVNIFGSNLLHLAAKSESCSMVRFLLDAGVDVNLLDEYQRPPLHYVTGREAITMTRMFLESGADPLEGRSIFTSQLLHPHLGVRHDKNALSDIFTLIWNELGAFVDMFEISNHSTLDNRRPHGILGGAIDGVTLDDTITTESLQRILDLGGYYDPDGAVTESALECLQSPDIYNTYLRSLNFTELVPFAVTVLSKADFKIQHLRKRWLQDIVLLGSLSLLLRLDPSKQECQRCQGLSLGLFGTSGLRILLETRLVGISIADQVSFVDHWARMEGFVLYDEGEQFSWLILASFVWRNMRAVNRLLFHGISVDVADREGRTLLFYATWHGSVPLVQTLLWWGADASISSKSGLTISKLAVILLSNPKCDIAWNFFPSEPKRPGYSMVGPELLKVWTGFETKNLYSLGFYYKKTFASLSDPMITNDTISLSKTDWKRIRRVICSELFISRSENSQVLGINLKKPLLRSSCACLPTSFTVSWMLHRIISLGSYDGSLMGPMVHLEPRNWQLLKMRFHWLFPNGKISSHFGTRGICHPVHKVRQMSPRCLSFRSKSMYDSTSRSWDKYTARDEKADRRFRSLNALWGRGADLSTSKAYWNYFRAVVSDEGRPFVEFPSSDSDSEDETIY